jgi:hypothetical protein
MILELRIKLQLMKIICKGNIAEMKSVILGLI